jgi:hypothetical protein
MLPPYQRNNRIHEIVCFQVASKLCINGKIIPRLLKMTVGVLDMSVKMFLWSSIFFGVDVGARYVTVNDDSRTLEKIDAVHPISTRNIRNLFIMVQNCVFRVSLLVYFSNNRLS